MKITVIAFGRLGQEIYQLKSSVTGSYFSKPKGIRGEYFFDFQSENYPQEIQDSDIIIFNLTPTSIKELAKFQKFTHHFSHKKILFVSSTSVYGQAGILNEDIKPMPKTENGKFLLECEKIILSLRQNQIIRPAGLYDDNSHPGLFLAKKGIIHQARERVNLISRKEVAQLILKLIEHPDIRILNAVNINHPTKEEYYIDFIQRNKFQVPQLDISDSIERIIETKHKEWEVNSELP